MALHMSIESMSKIKKISQLFIITSICIAFLSASFTHRFNVSVTQIKYSCQDQALQMTIKTSADDLVGIINSKYNNKLDIGIQEDDKRITKLIKSYLIDHVQIRVDGTPKKLHFLGKEDDPEAIWVYFEIPEIKSSPKMISIRNTIFFELHKEQRNNINFNISGKKKTSVLIHSRPEDIITF